MSPALHQRQLLVGLLATLLVTAAIPAGATTTTVVDSTAPSPPVSFGSSVTTEHRGDVAEVAVSFSNGESATVRIGSEEAHVATVTVRDTDGDDRGSLRVNTYSGAVAAGDGATVMVRRQSDRSTPLAPRQYDLTLWAGNDTDGERWDVATLVVEERATDALRTWVAPESTDLSNLSEVRAAKSSGLLTNPSSGTAGDPAMVAYGEGSGFPNDTLVLELQASGLEGALAAGEGSNVTARFFQLLEEDAVSLRIRQTNPGPSFEGKEIHLAESDAVTVVGDARNDTYYFVADPNSLKVTGGPDGRLHEGDEYRTNLTTAAELASVSGGRQSATTRFAFQRPRAVVPSQGFYDDDFRTVSVAPARNQTVRGWVTLPPNRSVTVRLRSLGDARSLSKTVTVRDQTRGEGWQFVARFDLRDVARGTNFTVDVRTHDRSIVDSLSPTYVVVEENATTAATTRRSTSTPTVSTPATTTPRPTSDRPAETTRTPHPERGVEGFGVVATVGALVALLAGLALARRE